MEKAMDLGAVLEYPGRVIVVGRSRAGERAILLYAVTGRSASSQARRLVRRDDGIWVEPTDEEVLKKGRVDLLVYPAILFAGAGIAVSNGKQTADIRAGLRPGAGPVGVLAAALAGWDYEPDAPIFTPRISACLLPEGAGLSVVRRGPSGETLRSYFEVPLRPGEGRLISTYEGPNRDPLPCFSGEPRPVGLGADGPGQAAEAFFADLAPGGTGPDFRVAVACVFAPLRRPHEADVHIINRHERI